MRLIVLRQNNWITLYADPSYILKFPTSRDCQNKFLCVYNTICFLMFPITCCSKWADMISPVNLTCMFNRSQPCACAGCSRRRLQYVQPDRLSPAADLHVYRALPGSDETRPVPESQKVGVPNGRVCRGVGRHPVLLCGRRYKM